MMLILDDSLFPLGSSLHFPTSAALPKLQTFCQLRNIPPISRPTAKLLVSCLQFSSGLQSLKSSGLRLEAISFIILRAVGISNGSATRSLSALVCTSSPTFPTLKDWVMYQLSFTHLTSSSRINLVLERTS